MRDEVFLDAGDEDRVVLETLRGVERHERDGAGCVVEVVGVGDEGDLGEEVDDRAVGVVAGELARDRDELVEVLQPRFVLRIAARAQRIRVSALVQQQLQALGDRGRRGELARRRQHEFGRLRDHRVELQDGRLDLRADPQC